MFLEQAAFTEKVNVQLGLGYITSAQDGGGTRAATSEHGGESTDAACAAPPSTNRATAPPVHTEL
jgi:hypothetical protein